MRVLSRDQVSKDSDRNKSFKEIRQKDSNQGELSAKELEQQRLLTKESSVKEVDRGRAVNRDLNSEKGRQINRSTEKGAHSSIFSSNRETDRNKVSSRSQFVEKGRSLSRDTGLRDSNKHRQHSRESGKDSGQGKDRPSSRDSDKSRLHSRDSSHRSTERNKDNCSGKDSHPGSQSKPGGEMKSRRLTPAGQGQSSPPVGTALVTGLQADKQGKHTIKDQEHSASPLARHKPISSSNFIQMKDNPNSGKVRSSGSGNLLPTTLHKDSHIGKSGSPQPSFQKTNLRKSNDYTSGPTTAVALKPLWPSRTPADDNIAKQVSTHLASPAAKDKHPKVKTTGSREVSKDRERDKNLTNSSSSSSSSYSLFNNNNNIKATGSSKALAQNPSPYNSSNSKASMIRNNTKAHGKAQGEKLENQAGDKSSSKNRETFSGYDKKNSSSLDNLQHMQQTGLTLEKSVKTSSQSHTRQTTNQLSSGDKKRSLKPPTSTSLMADPNGTSTVDGISSTCLSTTTTSIVSSAGQGGCRSACSTLFSSPSASSSDSSESDTQPHADDLHKEHSQGLLTQVAEDDADGQDDDRSLDDKHHEDDSDGSGSAKRRYPRRSARARSNMFFGLTPFYGVRSYGEEDLPFYGSGEGAGAVVKKRSGRKKSAEGQVDGADDISTSSSSGDSGDDDNSSKDPYYYNFTRTIINPGEGLPSIEGIDQCLGQGSQLQRFLKDEEQQQQKGQANTDKDMLTAL